MEIKGNHGRRKIRSSIERRPPRLGEHQAIPDDIAPQTNPIDGCLKTKLNTENALRNAKLNLHRKMQWIIGNLRLTNWERGRIQVTATLTRLLAEHQTSINFQTLHDFKHNEITNIQLANILTVANHRIRLDSQKSTRQSNKSSKSSCPTTLQATTKTTTCSVPHNTHTGSTSYHGPQIGSLRKWICSHTGTN